MPTYRVQTTKLMYPQPEDWTTILETDDRRHAVDVTSTFDDLPYPNATRWQRLFCDDTIVLIRKPVKPRIKFAGRDAAGVARWWIVTVDKNGIGGSSGAYGPLAKVYAEVMKGHLWYVDRHGLART